MNEESQHENLVRQTVRQLRNLSLRAERQEVLDLLRQEDVQAYSEVMELIRLDPTLQLGSAPSNADNLSDLTFVGEKAGDDGGPRVISSAMPESQVGEFRIIRQIGTGGMGLVYEAEQENPNRRVALKVMRADLMSESLRERFQFEAEILGRLDHPNIARIFASGWQETAVGKQPWFAMELVEGLNILAYVQKENLSLEEKVALFLGVVEAVHGAHQKGVIHRDLKPANVMVDGEGRVKVLDFGLAKLADSTMDAMKTQTGQLVGTLNYMSPEQAGGDSGELDLRTDVYSLGCVLYELLSGVVPVDTRGQNLTKSIVEIQEKTPEDLGTINLACRGDLALIVGKAIAKDKEMRYGSAAALGEDLRRFLANEAIVARPPSAWYQLKKLGQRNRVAFLAIVCVLAAIIVGGVISLKFAVEAEEHARIAENEKKRAELESTKRVRLAEEARRESKRAETEAKARLKATERSNRYSQFIIETFANIDPNIARGKEISLRQAMQEVEAKFEKSLGDDPESLARLHGFFASMSESLGDPVGALDHAKKSVDLLKQFPQETKLHARVEKIWALSLARLGRVEEAELHLKRAEEILKTHGLEEGAMAATLLADKAELYERMGRYKESLSYADRALALRLKIFGPDHEDVIMSRFIRASILTGTENLDLAKEEATRCLEYRSANLPRNHPLVAEVHNLMARIAVGQGEIQSSIQHTQAAIAIQKVVFPEGARPLRANLMNLGFLYMQTGKLDLAGETVKAALQQYENSGGQQDPVGFSVCYITLSDIYDEQKKLGLALAAISKAVALLQSHPGVAPVNLAHALSRKGSYLPAKESEPIFRQARDLFRKVESRTSPNALAASRRLAVALMRQEKFIESRELLEELRTEIENSKNIPFRERLATHINLGLTYDKLKMFDKAEESLLHAYRLCQEAGAPAAKSLAAVKKNLFDFYRRSGEKEKASTFKP